VSGWSNMERQAGTAARGTAGGNTGERNRRKAGGCTRRHPDSADRDCTRLKLALGDTCLSSVLGEKHSVSSSEQPWATGQDSLLGGTAGAGSTGTRN
jgi:hypothetical protein